MPDPITSISAISLNAPHLSLAASQNISSLLQGIIQIYGWDELEREIHAADQAYLTSQQELRAAIEAYQEDAKPSNKKKLIKILEKEQDSVEKELQHAREQQAYYEKQAKEEKQAVKNYTWQFFQIPDGVKNFFNTSHTELVEKYKEVATKRDAHLEALSNFKEALQTEEINSIERYETFCKLLKEEKTAEIKEFIRRLSKEALNNIRDKNGRNLLVQTLLFTPSKNPADKLTWLKYLLDADIDTDTLPCSEVEGYTLLEMAVNNYHLQKDQENINKKIIELLLSPEYGLNVDERDNQGLTSINLAISKFLEHGGSLEVLQMLIAKSNKPLPPSASAAWLEKEYLPRVLSEDELKSIKSHKAFKKRLLRLEKFFADSAHEFDRMHREAREWKKTAIGLVVGIGGLAAFTGRTLWRHYRSSDADHRKKYLAQKLSEEKLKATKKPTEKPEIKIPSKIKSSAAVAEKPPESYPHQEKLTAWLKQLDQAKQQIAILEEKEEKLVTDINKHQKFIKDLIEDLKKGLFIDEEKIKGERNNLLQKKQAVINKKLKIIKNEYQNLIDDLKNKLKDIERVNSAEIIEKILKTEAIQHIEAIKKTVKNYKESKNELEKFISKISDYQNSSDGDTHHLEKIIKKFKAQSAQAKTLIADAVKVIDQLNEEHEKNKEYKEDQRLAEDKKRDKKNVAGKKSKLPLEQALAASKQGMMPLPTRPPAKYDIQQAVDLIAQIKKAYKSAVTPFHGKKISIKSLKPYIQRASLFFSIEALLENMNPNFIGYMQLKTIRNCLPHNIALADHVLEAAEQKNDAFVEFANLLEDWPEKLKKGISLTQLCRDTFGSEAFLTCKISQLAHAPKKSTSQPPREKCDEKYVLRRMNDFTHHRSLFQTDSTLEKNIMADIANAFFAAELSAEIEDSAEAVEKRRLKELLNTKLDHVLHRGIRYRHNATGLLNEIVTKAAEQLMENDMRFGSM